MKAVVYDSYGPPSVLHVTSLPEPGPAYGQVKVKVYAVSVNPVDWKVVSGKLKFITGKKFPKMTGIEGAGTIEETGPGVTGYSKGMRVFAALDYNGGVCAEFVNVPVEKVMPLDDRISFTEASTLAIAGITPLQGLRDKGQIRPGMNVLINGASGGVGTYAVQIAKLFGAKVTAVCSSANFDLVKRLGADNVIDYTKEDFTRNGENYNIIFDAVGTRTFGQVRRSLAKKGIYINIVPSLKLYIDSFATGMIPGKKAKAYMLKPALPDLKEVMDLVTSKKIKVIIDRVYSFNEAADAFEYSRKGHAKGKIVIAVRQETVGISELC